MTIEGGGIIMTGGVTGVGGMSGGELTRAQIRAKIRDVDKTVKIIKEILNRNIKKKKEEIKFKLDYLCDLEEYGTFSFVTDTIINTNNNTSDGGGHPFLGLFSSGMTGGGGGPPASGSGSNRASPTPAYLQSTTTVTATGASIADKGSNSNTNTRASPQPPPPLAAPVSLDSALFSQVLELWHQLTIYTTSSAAQKTKVVRIPTLIELIHLVKTTNKRYQILNEHTVKPHNIKDTSKVERFSHLASTTSLTLPSLHRPNTVPVPNLPSSSRTTATTTTATNENLEIPILDALAIELVRHLLPEYARLAGVDPTVGVDPVTLFPLNMLTWREIFKCVLTGHLLKDLGYGDADIGILMKGKIYTQYVDQTDRSILRLIRSRILHSYIYREDNLEAISGHNSGVCIRIPTPGPDTTKYATLHSLLCSLRCIPHTEVWLIQQLLYKCILWCHTYCDTSSPSTIKLIQYVEKLIDLVSTSASGSGDSSIIQHYTEHLISSIDFPSPSLSSVSPAQSYVTSAFSPSNILDKGGDEYFESMSEAREDVFSDRLIEPKTVFTMLKRQNLYQSICTAVADQLTSYQQQEQYSNNNTSNIDIPPTDTTDTNNMNTLEYTEPGTGSGIDNFPSYEENNINIQNEFINDFDIYNTLSIASQRMYIVIRILILHPLSSPFIYRIDAKHIHIYNTRVLQHVCLLDIKSYILQNKYTNNIYQYYTDILYIFDNAILFNLEHTTVNKSAQKLLYIFEKLFLEIVLNVGIEPPTLNNNTTTTTTTTNSTTNTNNTINTISNITTNTITNTCIENCYVCNNKKVNIITSENSLICDRCNNIYHIQCLPPKDTQLTPPVGKEWCCPCCIEQRYILYVIYILLYCMYCTSIQYIIHV